MRDSALTRLIIGSAIEIHRSLGPGLLEAVYEECLAKEFVLRGIPFERQKPIPLVYKDLKLECGYRLDFQVDRRIVLELKSIEAIAPIHDSVMLTYLRLSGTHLGLLVNFNVRVLKDGIRKYVWQYEDEEKDNAETQRYAERKEVERAMSEKKIRVLIAKPGLDGHDRGAKVIARALRDAGMEVIYTGLRQTPEMIASAAAQEDVDVIGLSILSGAHTTLCPQLMKLLYEKGMDDVTVLVGGIIPEADIPALKQAGIAEIFLPGTSTQDIVEFIHKRLAPA